MAPSILGLASAILGIPTITTFIQNLISALTRNSEYIENVQCTRNQLQEFEDEDLLGKMSILLTPTAYSDGSLNTVIPPYQLLSELVTNGSFDTDSDWTKGTGWTISGGKAIATSAPSGSQLYQSSLVIGKKYRATFTITDITSGAFRFLFGDGGNASENYTSAGTYTIDFTAAGSSRLGIRTVFTTSGSVDNISVKEIQEADFDFSRGSSATRVNEQGLVEDVQILSGELVQNGNFEQIGAELVTNGNFDTDSNWNLTNATIEGGVAKLQGGGSFSRVRQDINYTGQAKVTYTISFNNSSKTTIQLRTYGGGMISNALPATVGTHTVYVSFLNNGVSFQIGLVSGEEIHLDNVSIKEVGQNWSFGTGWSMGDGVAICDGSQSGNANVYQPITFSVGEIYKVSFDVSNYVSGTVKIVFGDTGGTVRSANGNYVQYFTFASGSNFYIQGNSSFIGSVDNVSVVEITDDTDLPRIDYSPYSGAGTCGHILLEPQRTNFVTYSEDFSQWAKIHSPVVTDNFIISPDGTQNAAKVVFSGVNSGRIEKGSSHASTNVTQSIYLKTESGTQAVSIGAISNNLKEVTVTNEWQRFEHTSTGTFPRVLCDDAATIYVWGAQLEGGDYATSYIPTSGSTVTRSADVANNSGNADLFNDSEGVLYAEIKKDSNALDNAFSMITIGDALNNRLQIALIDNSNDFDVLVGSSSGTNNISSAFNYGSYNKIALSYNSSGFKVFHDGTLVGSDSNTISGLNLQELKFRFANNTSYDFYGDVKCVAVFKEALSNDELELLTGEGYNSFATLAAAYNYNVI